MTYFVEVTDDDGNKTYEATEDVVAKSELTTVNSNLDKITQRYNDTIKLLDNSGVTIDDEQKIIIETPRVAPSPAKSEQAEVVTAPGVVESVAIDTEKLMADLKADIIKQIADDNKAAIEHQGKLQQLMKDNKLPDSYLSILEDSNNPETVAPMLGRELLKFGNSEAGSSDDNPDTVISQLFSGIDAQLGIKSNPG